jgi:hypothetical protein
MVGRPYAPRAARRSSERGDSAGLDARVDRQRATCDRDGHAVVAVAQRVAVAHRDDGDRRQDGAALLGQPDSLPAGARDPRGPEVAVELGGAARLERAVDGGQRDLADATVGARAPGQAALVEDREGGGAAAQALEQPAAGRASERALGVDLR